MVRQLPGGFEHLDHILRAGRLRLSDDIMHLQFHSKSSHSCTNVGRFLIPDDRGMAAFVGALPGRKPCSFRLQPNIVSAYIEPSFGTSGQKHVGFLPWQARTYGLAGICHSLAGLDVAFAAQVNAA